MDWLAACPIDRRLRARRTGRIQLPTDTRESLDNLKLERDAIALYDALAGIEKDERRAAAFRTIATNERRHAGIWASKLEELGVAVPPPTPPRLRVRFIIAVARLFGTHAVSDLVQALEGDEEEAYDAQSSPEVASIAADERKHAEIWKRLSDRRPADKAAVAGEAVATRSRRGGDSTRPEGDGGRGGRRPTARAGALAPGVF